MIEVFDVFEFSSLRQELRNLYRDDEIYENMLAKILIAKKMLRDF